MKVLRRGFSIDEESYYVESANTSADLEIKSCNISCGINELENVGLFIAKLGRSGMKPKEIANELKMLSKKGKDLTDMASTFVMISLANPSKLDKQVCSHLKKGGATVTRWRKNPNSNNKINVVIM